MSGHYHEHEVELLRMPWKRFAARWERLIKYSHEERQRREAREREREMQRLRQENDERFKGGVR